VTTPQHDDPMSANHNPDTTTSSTEDAAQPAAAGLKPQYPNVEAWVRDCRAHQRPAPINRLRIGSVRASEGAQTRGTARIDASGGLVFDAALGWHGQLRIIDSFIIAVVWPMCEVFIQLSLSRAASLAADENTRRLHTDATETSTA